MKKLIVSLTFPLAVLLPALASVVAFAPLANADDPSAQTITFAALPDVTFGAADFSVSASASSQLAVTFTASGNCTVSGDGTVAHPTAAGNCTITANQSGGADVNGTTWAAATPVSQTFNITAAAVTQYTLTYSSDANGSIQGSSTQTLNSGSDGSAVTPVPNSGFHFTSWSDASTQNPRTDTGVTKNISVTATFAANAVNHAPVSNSQTVTTAENTPITITLTASDADSGDVLSYLVPQGGNPSDGSITAINSSHSVTYTPQTSFTGIDSFTFITNDSQVNSNTATITINVTPTASSSPTTGPGYTTANLNSLLATWGLTGSGRAGDFNGDGRVDLFDFNLLMINANL